MHEYYIEVLDFKYPKLELLEYQKSIKEWKPNFYFLKVNIDSIKEEKWFETAICSEDLVERIRNNITPPFNTGAFKFQKNLAQGTVPFHIDQYRDCVLMLPLTDDNSGLQWVDSNNNILCEYQYKGPTIINSKIRHGIPTNNKDRIFFQVNIPCTWEYMKDNYKTIFKC
jgi:hypothetical protein